MSRRVQIELTQFSVELKSSRVANVDPKFDSTISIHIKKLSESSELDAGGNLLKEEDLSFIKNS